jgi:FAD-NAD(P)-binding
MTQYSWAVIGAGPAGIAAVGRLLDHGIVCEQITWIDPEFGAGDFGTKWGAVPSNTRVEVFLDYFTASPSFRFGRAPAFELNNFDPEQTCPLGVVAEPLVWISQHLCQRVRAFRAIATELVLANREWTITTQHETITSKNVILAVGSVPKKLSYVELDEIPMETVLDPTKLARLRLDGATVAVFGSSHSAMIALPNLLNTPVKKVINFYRSPLKYAVYFDDWTLFDDTGLKGQAADWARENIDGTCPQRLGRCFVGDPEFEKILRMCDHVVYTVGFERRRLPLTPQWGSLEYDPTNGILAPGLFGIGIAFPEYWIDPLGGGQYRVGMHKFMQRLGTALPLWLRYGA